MSADRPGVVHRAGVPAVLLTTVVFVSVPCQAASAQDSAPEPSIVHAKTEPPELAELRLQTILQMFPEKVYRNLVRQQMHSQRFVPLETPPPELTANARYGVNFVVFGVSRPWVYDREDNGDQALYLDLDANGAMDEEEVFYFEERGGRQVVTLDAELEHEVRGAPRLLPVKMRFTLRKVTLPGGGPKQSVIYLADKMVRRGSLDLPSGAMQFALIGTGGLFDGRHDVVYFDKDRDGKLDFDDRHADERYKVQERLANLDDASYSFAVERTGGSLTLTRLADKLPDRDKVAVGAVAPQFVARGLDGVDHDLTSLRGKVVLLDFWSIHCVPCLEELPNVVAAYERFHAAGFEVLGINAGDPLPKLREFLTEKRVPWPQIHRPGVEDTVFKRYRVVGLPTCYLIDREGRIVSNSARGATLERELNRLLGDGRR